MTKSLLDYALDCADRGWAVFTVSNDKVPRCPHGHLAASTDPARIAAMHRQYRFVLIGIRTGEASNVAVLDIDYQHGGNDWWQANRDRLPATRTHRTRSGGLHLLFRHQPGLRCSTARVAPGIDVKAEGGAFIYWPATGLDVLSDAPLAEWPEWLTSAPKPVTAPSYVPVYGNGIDKARTYATAALRNAVHRVAGTISGGRNAILNRETYSMMRFAGDGSLTSSEIADAMAHAGFAAGLDQREIAATLTSAMSVAVS